MNILDTDFERRGRESFAENAEEQPKRGASHEVETEINPKNIFLYFFSAPSAKPSRPLRSKNPSDFQTF
jgi:hypothetical protein